VSEIGTNYRLEIEVLSPVHIGSGRPDLVDDLDYVTARQIHVIDQERMLAALPPERWARAEEASPLSQLLSANEYARFARYTLNDPTGGGRVPRIIEHIKDVRGRAYIPGSSLKGAIRTALAWSMLRDSGKPVRSRELGRNPRFADDPLEAEFFGRRAKSERVDPNRDVLRTLHVADSRALSPEGSLELAQVSLYSLRGAPERAQLRSKGDQWRFFVEVLTPGTRLQTSVRLDDYLLQPEIARYVGMTGKQGWVRGWLTYCNAFSQTVIAHELDFYGKHPVPRVRAFYDKLAHQVEAAEPGRECLLQMSWGAGWVSKTVGMALDDTTLAEIRDRYRLGRQRDYPIFPKSRRLVERGNVAEMPMGWVRLRLTDEIDEIGEPFVPEIKEVPPPEPAEAPRPTVVEGKEPRRIEDLQPGMVLEGTVRRIVSYGAFVDIGVRRDGLVHISELTEGWVEDVGSVVREGQRVRVKVLDVDLDRGRIGLSMNGISL
jgi:CRISPR-associated protein Csm5